MTVTCDKCKTEYDDQYRLTYCPHVRFAMRTTVAGSFALVGMKSPDRLDAYVWALTELRDQIQSGACGRDGVRGVARSVEELNELMKPR